MTITTPGVLDHVNLHLVDSVDVAHEFKRWLGNRRDKLGVDTETGGFSFHRDRLRLVQFGDLTDGWAIPWERWGGVAQEALKVYEGPMVLHNAPFDARFLEHHGAVDRWRWSDTHDTMTMSHLAHPKLPHGLKPLGALRVDAKAAAAQRILADAMTTNHWTWDTVPLSFTPYWVYAAMDPVLTCFLDQDFYPTVQASYREVYDLEIGALAALHRMMMRGVKVDLEYCYEKRRHLDDYASRAKDWVTSIYGVENVNSNAQLIRTFQELGVTITRKTDSGAPSIDKYMLQLIKFRGGFAGALADTVLNIRKAEKNTGPYFSNFIGMADGDARLHPTMWALGTRTARMSITDPALQTLPKKDGLVRAAFVPSTEDSSLITCDMDQIEMRLLAHFSQDPGLIQAFMDVDEGGGDFFINLAVQIYGDPSITKKDQRRQYTKNCVPLSSEILTRRGWLTHDQVVVGDNTLGYDFATGTTRWTKVTGVLHSPDTEVYRLSNTQRETYCTRDHRWVADTGRMGGAIRFIHAYEQPGTENRIILAACAEDGPSDVTPHEATILGWVLGDGSINRGAGYVGAPSQGRDGWKTKCHMSICQSKPDGVAMIDKLLHDVPHTRRERGTQVSWVIDSAWSRSLLLRAGIHDKKTFDPWQVALSLSNMARRAMTRALDDADGKNKKTDYFAVVQAADSPVAELCVALGYLTGHYARNTRYEPIGVGWQRNPIKVIWHQRPTLTGQRTTLTPVGREDTWCVTTELGSWTMRQPHDNVPVITGNTAYGKAYGAGVSKMAQTAGVPFEIMEPVVQAFDASFPGVRAFQKDVERAGNNRKFMEGEPYVMTPYGRRLPADDEKVYVLVNYLIQSHAAEYFKRKIVELDAVGLGPYMVLPVHDELVFDLPNDIVAEAKDLIESTMTDRGGYAVPITASADVLSDNWGSKYQDETPQEMIS